MGTGLLVRKLVSTHNKHHNIHPTIYDSDDALTIRN